MSQNSKRYGKDIDAMVNRALRYVLSQDVSVVILGLRSEGEVETAAKVGEQYIVLTTGRTRVLQL
jgi:predicted aldo/keto reductase-like oxidoreductase